MALAQQSRGMTMHEFEAAALEACEGIDLGVQALEARIAQADHEVAKADIAANQADLQLQEWRKASDEAARARQDAAFCARKLQDHVAEYATLASCARSPGPRGRAVSGSSSGLDACPSGLVL